MHLQRFTFNPLGENTYLLWDDNGDAVIIDSGAYFPEEYQVLSSFINDKGLRISCALQTHAHFDHLMGAQYVFDTYGVTPHIHPLEEDNYHAVDAQIRQFLHRDFHLPLPPQPCTFSDGDTVASGTIRLKVLHTPGHTPGGVCFYVERARVLFSGDTLFRRSVGRTDFPGGSSMQLLQSIHEKILSLPDNVSILPGHGESTTVLEERIENPYLFT